MSSEQEYGKSQTSQMEFRSKPEDPPPYDSISSPFGLERLTSLERVDVRNKDVVTENGEVLFKLKRNMTTNGLNFEFDLYDRAEKLVISIRPKVACFKPRYEVVVGGELAVVVRIRLGFPCRPGFVVHDATTTHKMLKIYLESMTDSLFRIKDIKTKQSVGYFALKRQAGAERMFTDSTEFQVSVSQDMDVRYKAAVISICILYIQDANLRGSRKE